MDNLTFDCSIPPTSSSICSEKGMILPWLNEEEWHVAVRAILYFLGMLYFFLGLSIAADIFIVAIERITSETRVKKVYDPDTGEQKPTLVKVWNPTVANLTLMALGSSAPEILLSIIEIVGRFQSTCVRTKPTLLKVWNPTVANLTLMALGSSAPEILLSIIEIVGRFQSTCVRTKPTLLKVWNPTVANLTLMALGSSAPEILLSIIEIVGRFQSTCVRTKPTLLKVWNPTVANLTLMALGSSAPEILLSIIEIVGRFQSTCVRTKPTLLKVWNPTVAHLTLMALGSSAPEILLSIIEIVGRFQSTCVRTKPTLLKVWNPTVANLTLMALGSSAPEILLSIIEIVGRFQSTCVRTKPTLLKVWNPTVANLTLMALGSSAPEILLSIIEIVGRFQSTCVRTKPTLLKVWNPTVANLTLMALGSSAPEILLSIIEIVGRFQSTCVRTKPTLLKVWNPTVANLTLMALGSSAPEILLSIIEIVGRFQSTCVRTKPTLLKVWNPTVANLTLMALGSSAPEILLSIIEIVGRFQSTCVRTKPTLLKVWNPTVANLTLMALGSSAPEILLSIIEIVGNNFQSGALGPSTIVGSAAFNLLVITAVCIGSIKTPETRRIDQFWVFLVTSFFGLFAYIWLLVVLLGVSKNEVELFEALATLGFFVVLILGAYIADKEICCRRRGGSRVSVGSETSLVGGKSKKRKPRGENLEFEEISRELAIKNPNLTEDQVAKLAANAVSKQQSHSRVYYRLQATKWMSNAINEAKEQQGDDQAGNTLAKTGTRSRKGKKKLDWGRTSVQFTAEQFAAAEKEGTARVNVERTGDLSYEMRVFFETIEGSAKRDFDYRHLEGLITFKPGQDITSVSIPILVDNVQEKDEIFYIKLDLRKPEDEAFIDIGDMNIAEVLITEKMGPCVIEFEKPSVLVEETTTLARVPIIRQGTYNRPVSVFWETRDIDAVDGEDYVGGKGEVIFNPGEVRKAVEISIIDDVEVNEKHETFEIRLRKISKNATLGSNKTALVTIIGDERVFEWFSKVDKKVQKNLEELNNVGSTSLRDQFVRALNVNNADIERATVSDYFYHILSFGWKLIFAFMPPPTILKGWLTFFVALGMIGLLTAFVADFAGIFGCLVGLDDAVTAITFVALGTSLPDLFASRLAATMEKTADSSVGNINGSNSVNVFVGLGLPWTIATAYWYRKGQPFCVFAGNLAFSVTVYSVTALLCLILLLLRRYGRVFGCAELGGPAATKWLSALFLVILWIAYVVISSLKSYGLI